MGQGTVLVSDINQQSLPAPANPASMVKVNPGSGEILMISVEDALGGSEIWKSDGTPAGTSLVKDIVPGGGGSAPVNLTTVGNRVFFSAQNGASPPKRHLWVTNGQAAGTNLVKNFQAFDSSGPEQLFNFGGTLFFEGFSSGQGREFWRSNGTEAGTTLVSDIVPGINDSRIGDFFAAGSNLYFTATDGTNDVGLYRWRQAGNQLSRLGDSEPLFILQNTRIDPSFAVMNGLTYFAAFSGTSGIELWRTNGEPGGTELVADIFTGSESSEPKSLAVMTITGAEAGTYLYFAAAQSISAGVELWRSNGSATAEPAFSAPVELKNISSADGASSNPGQLTVVGSLLFFTADDGTGVELHVSNGRTGAANTQRVADIVAGAGSSNPGNFHNFNNTTLLFTAVNAANNLGLYTCASGAGLPNSVTRIKDLGVDSMAGHLTQVGSKVYFLLNDSQLWETDLTNSPAGNSNGTKLVHDFRAGTLGSEASAFSVVGNEVFFSADDGANGKELWRSDGTGGGTVMVEDVFPGNDAGFPPSPNSSDPQWITSVGTRVFFSAQGAVNNRELWVYDPDADPKVFQVKEINPGGDSDPEELINLNGLLLFTATDGTGAGTTGREIWRSDGTPAGTVLVRDLATGTTPSNPRNLTLFKNEVYFFANGDGVGRELFKSNGTTDGTVLVKDIAPGSGFGITIGEEYFAVTGTGTAEKLYFSARNDALGGGGQELWTSNGTEAGTVRVRDINPGVAGSNPREITAIGTFVYFSATDGTNGVELWRSNGTENGTVMVRDIAAGATSSTPQNLTASGGRLFFTADDGVNGRQLWVSAGTSVTTTRLTGPGTPAGAGVSGITDLKDISGALVFSASDGVNGRELWISDGTTAGTRMINDISGAPASSNPGNFTNFLGQLLYTATDAESGNEPRIAFIGSDIRVEQPESNELANNGAAVDFGVADVAAKESITLLFTIRNTGLNTLRDIKPLLGGLNASEFSLVSPKPASALTQNQTTTFGVKFTPKEGGPRVAQVSIINSDAAKNPFIVNLVGTGVKDPTVTDHPDSFMVHVGEPVSFDAMAVSTSVTLTDADYQWRRNNGAIRGANGTSLDIPEATLKNAGAYSVAVKVGKSTAISNPGQLGVVQPNLTPPVLAAAKGKSATLKVVAAGNGLTFQWFLKATPLADTPDGRIKGAQGPTLVVANLDAPDSGLYTCQVTGPGGMRTGGQTELKVFTEKPVLDDPQEMPDGIVGGSYGFPLNGFQIKVDPAAEKAPTSFSATGLPSGLKVDRKTGMITGRPTKPFPGGKDVVLGAANTQKADTVSDNIIIKAFPPDLAGVYSATVNRDATLNDELGGRLDVTISATGALSGTLMLGAERISIKGGIEVDASEVLPPTFTTTLKRKGGKPDVTLTFDIDTTQRELAGNASGVPVNGWRQAVGSEITPFIGYYTFGLELVDPNHLGEGHLPQGWTFAGLTIAKNGKWKLAGRTADGEAITSAASVGFGGQVIVYQSLYKPFTGSMLGSLIIDPVDTNDATDNTLSGDVDWVRPANTNVKTRAYQAGFGLLGTPEESYIPLEAVGGIYLDPTKAKILVMELPSPGTDSNVRLDFEEGGLAVSTQDPDHVTGILDGNKISKKPPTASPTNTLLKKLVAKTGMFEGTFRLTDPDLRAEATGTLTRDAVFRGILIRDDVEMKSYGVGHFLLEQRPQDGEVPKKTTPVLGGWLELRENP